MTTERKSVESYIPESHEPRARPSSKMLRPAAEELIKPFPSAPLLHFPKITHLTGGLRPFEFTIFCGATGTGKTTFVANLSRCLIEQGVPHFVASVETGPTDFVKRVMSAMAMKDWNTGDAVPVAELKAFNAKNKHFFDAETLHLSLYEDRFHVRTLMADIAWMVKHKGIRVAMVDNMNFFMEVTAAKDQVAEMDKVVHDLIIFCKNVDVHLIMVMHPKKTETGRVDSEFDIKGSSTAVQEAHNVLLWNRPHPDLLKAGVAEPNDRELMIAKMRRKGKYVRRRLIMKAIDGVTYIEGEIV